MYSPIRARSQRLPPLRKPFDTADIYSMQHNVFPPTVLANSKVSEEPHKDSPNSFQDIPDSFTNGKNTLSNYHNSSSTTKTRTEPKSQKLSSKNSLGYNNQRDEPCNFNFAKIPLNQQEPLSPVALKDSNDYGCIHKTQSVPREKNRIFLKNPSSLTLKNQLKTKKKRNSSEVKRIDESESSFFQKNTHTLGSPCSSTSAIRDNQRIVYKDKSLPRQAKNVLDESSTREKSTTKNIYTDDIHTTMAKSPNTNSPKISPSEKPVQKHLKLHKAGSLPTTRSAFEGEQLRTSKHQHTILERQRSEPIHLKRDESLFERRSDTQERRISRQILQSSPLESANSIKNVNEVYKTQAYQSHSLSIREQKTNFLPVQLRPAKEETKLIRRDEGKKMKRKDERESNLSRKGSINQTIFDSPIHYDRDQRNIYKIQSLPKQRPGDGLNDDLLGLPKDKPTQRSKNRGEDMRLRKLPQHPPLIEALTLSNSQNSAARIHKVQSLPRTSKGAFKDHQSTNSFHHQPMVLEKSTDFVAPQFNLQMRKISSVNFDTTDSGQLKEPLPKTKPRFLRYFSLDPDELKQQQSSKKATKNHGPPVDFVDDVLFFNDGASTDNIYYKCDDDYHDTQTVTLEKDVSFGLTFSVIKDSLYVNSVQVGSSAEKVGIKFGDEVFQMNGTKMACCSQKMIKNFLDSISEVTLRYQICPFTTEHTFERFKSAEPLGLLIEEVMGNTITGIRPKSLAAKNNVQINSSIIEVNGKNCIGLQLYEVLHLLATSMVVKIKVVPRQFYEDLTIRFAN